MTCKDCIHSGLCYKENDFNNFPDRCGDFISDKVLEERPQGEWKHNNFDEHYCNKCGHFALYSEEADGYYEVQSNFCPNCGADMKGEEE